MENIIDRYLYEINEGKATSTVKVTRGSKIKKATSQMATSMAKEKNDPLYAKMKKACDKCKKMREQIHKKYSSKVRSRALR